jgi:hypothetical protein
MKMEKEAKIELFKETSEFGKKLKKYEGIKKQLGELTLQEGALGNIIKEELLKKKIDEAVIDDSDEEYLSFLVYDKMVIKYDEKALKEKLSKEQLAMITDINLSIDRVALKKFLAKHPDLRDELKEMVKSEKTINYTKLDYAFAIGHIKLNDLKGAYKTDVKKVMVMKRKKKKK